MISDREKLLNERKAVVAALEMPGLTPEQRARGWKRYDELESELAFMVHQERKQAEGEPQTYTYQPEVQSAIDGIRNKLDPDGKRRRRA